MAAFLLGLDFDISRFNTQYTPTLDSGVAPAAVYPLAKSIAFGKGTTPKWSKYCLDYTLTPGFDHQMVTGVYCYLPTRSLRYITYYWWMLEESITGTSDVQVTGFCSHGDSDSAPDGNVRLEYQLNGIAGSGNFAAMGQVKSSGSWGDITGLCTAITPANDYHLWGKQIDTTDEKLYIVRDGLVIASSAATGAIDPAAFSTAPGLGGASSGKGTGAQLDAQLDSLFIYESDTDELLATTYGVWGIPMVDDGVGDWSAYGQAANCVLLCKAVDDVYDAADPANDYIYRAGEAGANHDQLLKPYQLPAGEVKGVTICVVSQSDSPTCQHPDQILSVYGASTEAVNVTWDAFGPRNYFGTAAFKTRADGAAWDRAGFNASYFGVRSNTAIQKHVWGILASVVGTGISIPPDVAACPAAGSLVIPRRSSTLLRM